MTAPPGELRQRDVLPVHPASAAVPHLSFAVVNAEAEPYAAVPTLRFMLAIESPEPHPAIRSLLLATQIRIAVARRTYDAREHARLAELFGTPDRWGETLKSLLWTHTTTVSPAFEGKTELALLVPCTCDFDIVSAKYLSGVESGDIPLDFLFSGSVFYDDADGRMQTARLSWESEARYALPVRVWKDMMNHYYPDSSWIRLRRDEYDRLYAYRAERSLQTWEHTVDALLSAASREPEHG